AVGTSHREECPLHVRRPAGVRVDYLADHPDVLSRVACWLGRHWFNRLGRSRRQCDACLRSRLNRDRPALALVAFAGAEAIGTASIAVDVVPGPVRILRPAATPHTHCLAGVYVVPKRRGRGVGSALCRRALAEAERMELPSLDLYTADREAYYARLGWRNPLFSAILAGDRWHGRTFMEHPLSTPDHRGGAVRRSAE